MKLKSIFLIAIFSLLSAVAQANTCVHWLASFFKLPKQSTKPLLTPQTESELIQSLQTLPPYAYIPKEWIDRFDQKVFARALLTRYKSIENRLAKKFPDDVEINMMSPEAEIMLIFPGEVFTKIQKTGFLNVHSDPGFLSAARHRIGHDVAQEQRRSRKKVEDMTIFSAFDEG